MRWSNVAVASACAALLSMAAVHGWPHWGNRRSAADVGQEEPFEYRTQARKPRPGSRPLDLVLTHFHHGNLPAVLEYWQLVLDGTQLRPYFFIYCKGGSSLSDFGWMQDHGELHTLPNVGRESHSYLWHIMHHRHDLAEHTLFNQAMPDMDNASMILRLKQFEPSTGMLGLAMVVDCGCADCFLGDIPFIREIWAMSQNDFCSPDLKYATFLKGAFVVSKKRLLSVPEHVYHSLISLLTAPQDHWIHQQHHFEALKGESNPLAGHILERSWNIIFDCIDVEATYQCWKCDSGQECPPMACQCRDQG